MNMEIQIQCAGGEISRFAMTDEQSGLQLIESIKPSEFFSRPLLRIQAGKRTTIFNIKEVESVYFNTSLKARAREHPPAKDLRILSETEYRETLESLRRQYESEENVVELGHSVTTLAAIHCVSGATHCMQAQIIAERRLDQLMNLNNLLERLTSVIPCSPEGYIAINPRNIKTIEIYPAPRETANTAWLVD